MTRVSKPNIIYVYADDLGRGMLSCYGQKHFKTPNIDRLAETGVRFTRSYGCAVCAPARASLITGYHDSHAGRWSYNEARIYKEISHKTRTYEQIRELINNTSFNEREDEEFLPHMAKKAGYVTGQVGKLEWGFSTTPERLAKHGWDYHYGYYDHERCHGFYPPFLFENGELVEIPGNSDPDCGVNPTGETPEKRNKRWDMTGKEVYSQDLFNGKIVEFITKHKDQSFFLYHPSQLPHGPISVPEIHEGVKDVETLTDYEKEYASMILRLDDTVGLIRETLEKLGILDNTMILFASDNGHAVYYPEEGRTTRGNLTLDGRQIDNIDLNYTSELVGDVFNGNDGLAGCKTFSLEGGARIPFIVSWSGIKDKGSVSDHLLANYDTMAMVADLLGVKFPSWKDGVSFLPTLQGEEQPQHEYVAFAGRFGPGLATPDGWKIRYITPSRRFQLFYLPDDYQEQNNLAEERPDKLKELGTMMLEACDGNFYHGTWENHKVVRIDQYIAGRGPEEQFPATERWMPIEE